MTNWMGTRTGVRTRRLPLGLFLLEFGSLTWLSTLGTIPVPLLFLGYAVAFVSFAVLVYLLRQEPAVPWLWFLAALVLRVPWLGHVPSLSDDVWRYLNDGRAQVAGINPYRYAPDAPEAGIYAGPERALINHAELPTIYPPAAQLAFRTAIHLGGTLVSWKILLLVFDLGIGAVLVGFLNVRGIPSGRAALYLFHPLPVIEFVGNGHVDALGIFALFLALWLVAGHRATAGVALAVSIAAKYLALPLLPFFARDAGAGKRVAIAAVTVGSLVMLYLPFLDYPPIGSLGVFARTFEFNGPVYSILSASGAKLAVRFVLGAALLLVLCYGWFRHLDAERAAFGWIAAVLLLSPIAHPWYAIWLLPFVAVRMRWWAFAWSGTAVLPYWVLTDWRATGVWHLPTWVMAAEYLPVYLLLLSPIYATWVSRRNQ
ncbi:MAG: hypothetical protein ACE5HT_09185 [Gemmatimonadales bacterium]